MEEHILKFEVDAKWSSFSESQVTLAPSLKYTGMNDEPPRLMGEGFVVLSSNTIDFYYYMDEPGIVPEVPLMIELANGDVVECHAPPSGVWTFVAEKEPISVTALGPTGSGNSFSNIFILQITNP